MGLPTDNKLQNMKKTIKNYIMNELNVESTCDTLVDYIHSVRSEYLNSKYVTVQIHTREGNIVPILKNMYPNYRSFHRSYGVSEGLNFIMIPRDRYHLDIKKALNKLDDEHSIKEVKFEYR